MVLTLQQQVYHTALCIKWHIAAKSYDLSDTCSDASPYVSTITSDAKRLEHDADHCLYRCNALQVQTTTVNHPTEQCHGRSNAKSCTVLRHAHFVLMASVALIRRDRINRKRRLSVSLCLSVRPHVSVRFPPHGFSLNLAFETFKNILRKSKFCLNWTKLPGTLHEALTRYVCTVSSSPIHFVARQHNKGNPVVRFYNDTKHFYVVKRNM